MCVFVDDDNVELVSMEFLSAKKGASLLADESAGSPAVLASHSSISVVNDRGVAAKRHLLHGCSCIENMSSVSPTHLTHCLLNSVVTHSQDASRVLDGRQG